MVENVEKTHNSRANNTVGFKVSGFPMNMYKEWKQDCIENYGDAHWIKIWSDHQAAINCRMFNDFIEKISELEERIMILEKKKSNSKNNEEQPITFGDAERLSKEE